MRGQVSRDSAGEYQADEWAGVARLSWRVSGKWAGMCRAANLSSIRQMSRQVSLSWVLVLTRFCVCPSKVHFPVQCKFWQLSGGLMVTSFKTAYAVPRSTAPRAPAPAAVHCCPIPSQETLTVLPQSLWGLWVLVHTRYIWALWVSLTVMGFYSKHDFAPPAVLLGLLLCPWRWDSFSKSSQCHAATAPEPIILLWLFCPWTWGISLQLLQWWQLQHHDSSILMAINL